MLQLINSMSTSSKFNYRWKNLLNLILNIYLIYLLGLGEKQLENGVKKFHEYDTNKNGKIDKDEFLRLTSDLVPGVSKQLLTRLAERTFSKADKDKVKNINWPKIFESALKITFRLNLTLFN